MRNVLALFLILLVLAPVAALADDAAPPTTATSSVAAPPATSTSSAAVTAPPAPNTFLSNLADAILKLAAGVVSVLLAWAVHKVIGIFQDKTGIALPSSTETLVNGWCTQGIAYAEQKGAAAIKAKTQALVGSDKLKIATDFVWGLVQQYGLEDYAQTTITAKIEALLGMQNAAATPATGTAPATTPPIPPAPIRAA